MPDWLQDWKTQALVVLGFFAALDGVIKHFALTKKLCSIAAIAMRYIADLFRAPLRIREIERWKAKNEHKLDPVYALNAAWFPSDTEQGRYDAYCIHCLADGKKIEIQEWEDGPYVRYYCGYNQKHYWGKLNDLYPFSVDAKEFKFAQTHAFDLRKQTASK